MKSKELATCCGGAGACVCTVSMLLAAIVGTAGTGITVIGSMNGMPTTGTDGFWTVINVINFVGQPLLILSVALILYGMRNFGKWSLLTSAVGGTLLYAGMYLLNMFVPMITISSAVLVAAYALAYGPIVKGKIKSRRKTSGTKK